MSLNQEDSKVDMGVAEDEAKTFLIEVSEEEAKLYPEYDGVNDVVDIEEAE